MLRVCMQILLSAHPSTTSERTFYAAYAEVTDYGACCEILPYLNFVNTKTANLPTDEYTREDWHSHPKSSQNGEYGGLKILLDAESFDFTYTGKDSFGFRIAFTDQRDTATVRQDGYGISPGKLERIQTHEVRRLQLVRC